MNKLLWNINRNSYVFIQESAFENVGKWQSFFSASMCFIMFWLGFHIARLPLFTKQINSSLPGQKVRLFADVIFGFIFANYFFILDKISLKWYYLHFVIQLISRLHLHEIAFDQINHHEVNSATVILNVSGNSQRFVVMRVVCVFVNNKRKQVNLILFIKMSISVDHSAFWALYMSINHRYISPGPSYSCHRCTIYSSINYNINTR